MTRQERALSVSLHSAQYPSFPPRFRARTDATLLRQAPIEGGRSAERRSGAAAPVGHAMTRRVRRLRGALRPMTRDARLSALHRGGFGLRGRASLTGICAGSVTASSSHPGRSAWSATSRASRGERLRAATAGRHASLRPQDRLENTPSMSEAANPYSIDAICSQAQNVVTARSLGVTGFGWTGSVAPVLSCYLSASVLFKRGCRRAALRGSARLGDFAARAR